jgi:hypothetical protein
MREVHGVNLSREVVNGTERFIVVAFVEQLDLVRVAASCDDQILVLLAELARVKEAG